MKRLVLILLFVCTATGRAAAWVNPLGAESLRLKTPEMEPRLVQERQPLLATDAPMRLMTTAAAPDTVARTSHWTWMRTTPGVRPYRVMDDLTFVGVPVFLAGILAKGEKRSFAQQYQNTHDNTRLVKSFKTGIDNYSQYFGPALALGLKVGGLEGRSDWGRFLACNAMSYGIMAMMVNGIKYTAKEIRPDDTSRNSWPSGHTATAFVGATVLHKEYGMTVSPWYSIAGYSVATATGIMRVLNNRHWVSDILSGAGIGIMSTELAYALSDLLFHERGLLRGDLTDLTDTSLRPSFFSISMGVGIDSQTLNFAAIYDGAPPVKLTFQTATVIQTEGAYFFSPYVGIGGRLRVKAIPMKDWEDFRALAEGDASRKHDKAADILGSNAEASLSEMIASRQYNIESDHLTEFSADGGLYFNLPLSTHFALGSKLLVGSSVVQECCLSARYAGRVKDLDYDMTIHNGELQQVSVNKISNRGSETYDTEWDYLTVTANNTTKWGTGLSLTYAYKHNFQWKAFCDFDYTTKTYTMTYNPDHYLQYAMPQAVGLAALKGEPVALHRQSIRKHIRAWVVGASFAVAF